MNFSIHELKSDSAVALFDGQVGGFVGNVVMVGPVGPTASGAVLREGVPTVDSPVDQAVSPTALFRTTESNTSVAHSKGFLSRRADLCRVAGRMYG